MENNKLHWELTSLIGNLIKYTITKIQTINWVLIPYYNKKKVNMDNQTWVKESSWPLDTYKSKKIH